MDTTMFKILWDILNRWCCYLYQLHRPDWQTLSCLHSLTLSQRFEVMLANTFLSVFELDELFQVPLFLKGSCETRPSVKSQMVTGWVVWGGGMSGNSSGSKQPFLRLKRPWEQAKGAKAKIHFCLGYSQCMFHFSHSELSKVLVMKTLHVPTLFQIGLRPRPSLELYVAKIITKIEFRAFSYQQSDITCFHTAPRFWTKSLN